MQEVFIYCSETGASIWTGKFSTQASLRAMALGGTIRVCPACQDSHHWESRDAWLADTMPRPTSRSASPDDALADGHERAL